MHPSLRTICIGSVRRAHGWTQKRLAAALNPPVHVQTITRWETGKTEISYERLQEIAALLQTPACELAPDIIARMHAQLDASTRLPDADREAPHDYHSPDAA